MPENYNKTKKKRMKVLIIVESSWKRWKVLKFQGFKRNYRGGGRLFGGIRNEVEGIFDIKFHKSE